MKRKFLVALAAAVMTLPVMAQSYKFDFSPNGKAKTGFTKVNTTDTYNDAKGWGYDFRYASEPSAKADAPFFFSVKVPDGNYKVTAVLGSPTSAGETTVRGESRRLFVENCKTKKGQFVTKSFIVNKRDTIISGNNHVRIKANERNKLNWDNRLTIEINGETPRIQSLEIEKVDNVPTLFLCGNSTVVDNDSEPYTSWGQMIPAFFDDKVAIANYAESGLAANSFVYQKRLEKVISQMKPGDYILMEFAHNDQKQKGNGAGAYYNFSYYIKQFLDAAQEKGVTPILLTPTRRRFFDKDGKIQDTHKDYPQVIREIAARENVDLIDLQHMTKVMCETLGVEGSKKLFVHYPAGTYKKYPKELKDNTHFSTYGAYEVAKCVLEGLRYNGIPVVEHIRPEYRGAFSPVMPDKFENFKWILSPFEAEEKPDGN